MEAPTMKHTGIQRRHFLAGLGAALSVGACTPVRLPRIEEGPPRVGVKTALRLGPAPVKGVDAKFAFIQINGAPAAQLMNFSRVLNEAAAERKINVVPVGDPSATYLVEGYLSAVSDRGNGLLVFVWDVTDSEGKRLHRVVGQEITGINLTDPWSGVTQSAIESAARRTIDNLAVWVK